MSLTDDAGNHGTAAFEHHPAHYRIVSKLGAGGMSRKRTELLNLQTQMAHDISEKLQTKLSGTEEPDLKKKYTSNPEAYELYLKGRYHWNRRTVEDGLKSLDYFQKAVRLDPKFALAYVGIPTLICSTHSFSRTTGRIEEGINESRRAAELDPYSTPIVTNSSYIYSLARCYDDAMAQVRRAVDLDDTIPIGRQRLGIAYEEKGMLPEAIIEYQAAVDRSNRVQLAVGSLAHAYARLGKQIEARKLLNELEERSSRHFVSPYLQPFISRSGKTTCNRTARTGLLGTQRRYFESEDRPET